MHKLFEISSFTLFLYAFCASLWPIKHLFSQLLYKAISMALWTKASLFSYITPSFRPQMARYASRFTRYELCSLLEQSMPRTPSRPIRSLPTYQVGSCNPRLIKDLRLFKALYICRELSTSVESSLQINLFMQNKANFQKVKFDVNRVLTRGYDQLDTWSIRKTKPIQSQLKPIKAN